VARRAGGGETRRGVRWLGGAIVVGAVAAGAIHHLAAIDAVAMASLAGRRLVRAHERERGLIVVEARVLPAVDRMTGGALRETGGLVIGDSDSSRVGSVATLAGGAAADELQLSRARARVTRRTGDGGVRTTQRESRQLVGLLHRRFLGEAAWRVAPRTIRAELALVDVLVA